jgi:hypothetical protein
MTKYKRAIDLMEADLGDELVALDENLGNCFGFNEVATWVWRRLAEPAGFDQLRDELIEQFDVSPEQCTRELRDFVVQMTAHGIIGPAL